LPSWSKATFECNHDFDRRSNPAIAQVSLKLHGLNGRLAVLEGNCASFTASHSHAAPDVDEATTSSWR
jgi:hypothetical protein